MLQYGMLNTKLKKYPIYFRFFSCIGQSDQQGVDRRMYASGCWNSFLEYSYIHFTKGQQVTQRYTEVTGQFTKSDSRYPNTSLFGLNSFKSLSYAVKSSGKHLLEA